MSTLNSLDVGTSWTDLNSLSGIPEGAEIFLQCTGKAGDIIDVAISESQPSNSFRGVPIYQARGQRRVPAGSSKVWVRYLRNDDTTPSKSVTKIQVQIEPAISELSSLSLSQDFLIRVGLGKVPGYSQAAVVMRNPACSNTEFTDVWAGTGNMTLATASETWEISSDSADDTNGGTGAWNVLINSLDDNKEIQPPQQVTLSGTNWVAIPGTHFRPHNLAATRGVFVLNAGSSESNVGTITVRDVATQQTRMVITPGTGINEDGQITAPTGFTLLALKVIVAWPKDESGELYNSIKPNGADTARISSGRVGQYQNIWNLDFQAKFITSEKTDRVFRAKSLNLGAELTVIQEFLVVDNDFL
jgi:hypothetical protein